MLSLWGMVCAYGIVLSMGAKKFDRYALPAFLAVDVLGAIGLALVLSAIGRRFSRGHKLVWALGLGTVTATQIALCVNCYPYYFSYFNPVLGGLQTAAKVMWVGWGEGLDQVSRYLESSANGRALCIGTSYEQILNYREQFRDNVLFFPPSPTQPQRFWPVQLDYAVVYINALQRYGLPRSFVELFGAEAPQFVARINGLEYAWVYHISRDRLLSLPPETAPFEATYGSEFKLMGYHIYPVKLNRARGESILPLTLHWRVNRPCGQDYGVNLSLIDAANTVWAEKQIDVPCTGWRQSWSNQWILPDDVELEILPGAPPGPYRVRVDVVHRRTGREVPPVEGTAVLLGPIEVN
jgi:hypothetical protein